jgi:hypothetical protein
MYCATLARLVGSLSGYSNSLASAVARSLPVGRYGQATPAPRNGVHLPAITLSTKVIHTASSSCLSAIGSWWSGNAAVSVTSIPLATVGSEARYRNRSRSAGIVHIRVRCQASLLGPVYYTAITLTTCQHRNRARSPGEITSPSRLLALSPSRECEGRAHASAALLSLRSWILTTQARRPGGTGRARSRLGRRRLGRWPAADHLPAGGPSRSIYHPSTTRSKRRRQSRSKAGPRTIAASHPCPTTSAKPVTASRCD